MSQYKVHIDVDKHILRRSEAADGDLDPDSTQEGVAKIFFMTSVDDAGPNNLDKRGSEGRDFDVEVDSITDRKVRLTSSRLLLIRG